MAKIILKNNSSAKMRITTSDGHPSDKNTSIFQFANNPADIVTHIYTRDQTQNINGPQLSDYAIYNNSAIPTTLPNGEADYNGTDQMLSLQSSAVVNFGSSLGNGFTFSTWSKISEDNPLNTYLMGTVASNNVIFGIILNRGGSISRDQAVHGNTLFYLRSSDSKYTTGYIEKNICTDKYINLTWTGQIDTNTGKYVCEVFVNGHKVPYYPINQEIDNTSTWSNFNYGLGVGLWSRGSYNNSTYDSYTYKNSTRYAKFINSTFTLYNRPLTEFEIKANYNFHKETFGILEEIKIPFIKVKTSSLATQENFSSDEGWVGRLQDPDLEMTNGVEAYSDSFEQSEGWQ